MQCLLVILYLVTCLSISECLTLSLTVSGMLSTKCSVSADDSIPGHMSVHQ